MGKSLFESLTSDLNIHRYSDWVVFANRLQEAIKAGQAVQVQRTRTIYVRSEQWYIDPQTGEIYVYVEPDDKVLPEWTRVLDE